MTKKRRGGRGVGGAHPLNRKHKGSYAADASLTEQILVLFLLDLYVLNASLNASGPSLHLSTQSSQDGFGKGMHVSNASSLMA